MNTPLTFALPACHLLLGAALLLASWRLLIGPHVTDRIAALDVFAGIGVAYSILLCIEQQNAAFIDLGIAIAVISFLSTVAFARYLETGKGVD